EVGFSPGPSGPSVRPLPSRDGVSGPFPPDLCSSFQVLVPPQLSTPSNFQEFTDEATADQVRTCTRRAGDLLLHVVRTDRTRRKWNGRAVLVWVHSRNRGRRTFLRTH